MKQTYSLNSADETMQLAENFGKQLKGGEVFELSGDLGSGKTLFVKGLAKGLGITDVIQSPTFTINHVYAAPDGLELHHYDFYRLNEAGILKAELTEVLEGEKNIVAIEWDETVRDVLPKKRTISCEFIYTGEESRKITITAPAHMTTLLKSEE